jgi:putative oxidoreductase
MNLDGFAAVLAGRGLPAAYPLAVLGTVVESLAALALVAGFKTRWAALALIAFTVIATLIAHRYWAVPPEQLTNQFNHFMKNLAIVGGLLAFVAAGPGRWSLDARAGP